MPANARSGFSAALYVQPPNWTWQTSPWVALRPGAWTEICWPGAPLAGLASVGVQVGGTSVRYSGEMFLDAVAVQATAGTTGARAYNGPTLSAAEAESASTAAPAADTSDVLMASWSGGATPSARDWLGLHQPGTPNTSYLAWRYTTGTASGEVPFTLPTSLPLGTHELRLLANNGNTVLVTSNSFTVGDPDQPVITAPPSSPPPSSRSATLTAPAPAAAGGTASVVWSGIGAPTSTDWIGVYSPGAADTAYRAWRYTTGAASGAPAVVLPATLAPGTYELRLFATGGFTRLATSDTFAVTAGPTLSASPSTVARNGTVTAAWSGVTSPRGTDWIGVYARGAPHTGYQSWRYTHGTQTGGSSGLVSAQITLLIPSALAPGSYELRYFANNGYTLVGTSDASRCSSRR